MSERATGFEPKQVLVNLVAGLSLADHMGDAFSDALKALEQIGVAIPEFDEARYGWDELAGWLVKNHAAETVWGTSLADEDEDEKSE